MAISQPVADAVQEFIGCDDLLQTKQLVERLAPALLSDEALVYLDAILAHYSGAGHDVSGLRGRREWLVACRTQGIALAFATILLELQPEPIGDEAAAAIAKAASADDVLHLTQTHPEWLGEIRRTVVSAQLAQELGNELQSARQAGDSTRTIALCRAALKLSDRRVDPITWAAFCGELGNALTASSGYAGAALDEAVELYRSALDVYRSIEASAVEANARHGLGTALVHRAQGEDNRDVREGLALLDAALQLRPRERVPAEWAQTQYAIGRGLMNWQGPERADRIEQAAARFDACLGIYHPAESPAQWLAAVLGAAETCLARERGKRSDHLRGAISLYRDAIQQYAQAGQSDELTNLQARLEHAYARFAAECLAGEEQTEQVQPLFDNRCWVPAHAANLNGITMREWVPDGASLSSWTELITVTSWAGAHDMPFEGALHVRRGMIESRSTNGTFTWEVTFRDPNEVHYRWRIVNDFALEDQFELVRMLRGERALHSIHYAARGSVDDAVELPWRARLDGGKPVQEARAATAPTQAPHADLGRLGVEQLLQELQQRLPDNTDPTRFYRLTMERAPLRSREPALWASISMLAGLALLRHPAPPPEWEEAAILALRRSLEVYDRRTQPEQWGRSVKLLASVFLSRRGGNADVNTAHARYGFEQAIRVFHELGLQPETADALGGLGNAFLRLSKRTDPGQLGKTAELYEMSAGLRDRDREPAAWADAMLALADTNVARQELDPAQGHRENAEAAYGKVLAEFASNPSFRMVETEVAAELMGRAMSQLKRMDQQGLARPRMPTEFSNRRFHGQVLYLRPLTSAGTLTFPNQFRDPASLRVQFPTEPVTLTVEAALYRVLGDRLLFTSLGGRAEGLGGTRMYLLGGEGWEDVVKLQFDASDLVLMIPHDSPGVRWEVQFLLDRDALGRVLFVMPPHSPTYDVPALWQGSVDMMRDFKLALPPYQDSGLVFGLDRNGGVTERIGFDAVWDNTLFEKIRHLLPAR